MWKFIVDVAHDFVSSLQPDVGRGFLHVSNVFLFEWYSNTDIANVLVLPIIAQLVILVIFRYTMELIVKVRR